MVNWSSEKFNVPSISRDLVKHILNNKNDMGYWVSPNIYDSSGESAHDNVQFRITMHDDKIIVNTKYTQIMKIDLADPDLVEKARKPLRKAGLWIHEC